MKGAPILRKRLKTSSQSSVDAIDSWIANSWIAQFTNTARRVSQNCKMSKTSATGPTGPTVPTVSNVPTVPTGTTVSTVPTVPSGPTDWLGWQSWHGWKDWLGWHGWQSWQGWLWLLLDSSPSFCFDGKWKAHFFPQGFPNFKNHDGHAVLEQHSNIYNLDPNMVNQNLLHLWTKYPTDCSQQNILINSIYIVAWVHKIHISQTLQI